MDNMEENHALKKLMFGFPTPSWKQTWPVEVAERELSGFKFTGIGWYVTAAQVLLVIPAFAVEGTPAEARTYEFCVWDGVDPRALFAAIADVKDQTPVPVEQIIQDSWLTLLTASKEIIAYVEDKNAKAIAAGGGAGGLGTLLQQLLGGLGLNAQPVPAALDDQVPTVIPRYRRHEADDGKRPHYHFGGFQVLVIDKPEFDEFRERVEAAGHGTPPDFRLIPATDSMYVAIFANHEEQPPTPTVKVISLG